MTAPDEVDAFCRLEYPRLVGALAIYTGDAELAEDLAQEALVRVCERWNDIRASTSRGAWAHRVAINLANSWFRRRRAEARARERHGPDSIEWVRDDAEALSLRSAIAGLPRRQREALVLRHVAGLSVAETAAAMHLTDGAVRALTHRAATAIRLELEPEEEAHHART